MDRDKLSRITAGILKMLVKATQQDRIDFDEDMAHEQIFYLLAPILDDAEKWKRFLAIQSCNDCPACPECPCDETNCPAIKIEDAFEGEGGKP